MICPFSHLYIYLEHILCLNIIIGFKTPFNIKSLAKLLATNEKSIDSDMLSSWLLDSHYTVT